MPLEQLPEERIRFLDARQEGFSPQLKDFLARGQNKDPEVAGRVREILEQVRVKGDAALCDYTEKFDHVRYVPEALRVPEQTIAEAAVDSKVEAALHMAADRIRAYHEHMRPTNLDYTDEQGVRLGARWNAVDAAGIYVPGGRAAYPSSVLMNAIPAEVAGVERIVMTVPTPDGILNPLYLVAARIAGVREIYRIGGAQAIAALAYGTEQIAPVAKIVGPGNAYVAEAKRQVFGRVGIDSIAGPSEVLVVADKDTPAAWVASDLLTQAEHDPLASSICITDDELYALEICKALESQLASLPRSQIASQALKAHGAIILVQDIMQDAAAVIDVIAPEHLSLCVADAEGLMGQVKHAGAIFLGRYASEALGDYVAGPSHVLPTYGTAAFSSGLSVSDFMKRSSFMGFDKAALEAIGPAAETLADAEGLQAHALSIRLRREGDV